MASNCLKTGLSISKNLSFRIETWGKLVLGTIVNCLTIIAGSLIGIGFRNGIPEKYNQTVMQAIGLAVILIGMKSALGQ